MFWWILAGDIAIAAAAIAIYHYGISGTIQKLKDDVANLKSKVQP